MRTISIPVRTREIESGAFFVVARSRIESARAIGPQFAIFCAVGVMNTLVDIGIYYVLTRSFLGLELIFLAKAVSYLVATLFSFFANRYFTFGIRGRVRLGELAKFYSTVGLGIFVNVGVLFGAVTFFRLSDLFGVLLAAVATALWGFALSKWYVFNR